MAIAIAPEIPEVVMPSTPHLGVPRGRIFADLHNHSTDSYDGGIPLGVYRRAFADGGVQLAVTDHNKIGNVALTLYEEFGPLLIKGEEVTSYDKQGNETEIIGLFLDEEIERDKPTLWVAQAIREQGGVVYIPHPYDRPRKGVTPDTLKELHERDLVDAKEIWNGRTLLWRHMHGLTAADWAGKHGIPTAAGSDAHGPHGWLQTGILLEESLTRDNFREVLASGELVLGSVGLRGLAYPKWNRFGPPKWKETAIRGTKSVQGIVSQ